MMLGMMLLGFVVYVGVMTAFTGVIQGSLADALTEVPTIHEYGPDGRRISVIAPDVQAAADPLLAERDRLRAERDQYVREADADGVEAAEAALDAINADLKTAGWVDLDAGTYALYRWFAIPATVILLFFIMLAAAAHFWERGIQLWRPGASQQILRSSVVGLVVIWLLPEVWDIYAISMTQFSLYMMHPGGDPQQVVDALWCKMGAAGACMFDFASILDPVSWSTALANPADFGQTLLGEILMPFFMLTPALLAALGVFVTATVRVLFISIVLITIPVWMVLRNLPIFERHARQLTDSMIGATLAPFLSALTLYVGWVWLESTAIPSVEEWISVLGIVTLAGAWPLLLAPFLSTVSGQVQGWMQTAVQSSSMMAMQMGMGATAGAVTAAEKGVGWKGVMGGLGAGAAHGTLGAMPHDVGRVAGEGTAASEGVASAMRGADRGGAGGATGGGAGGGAGTGGAGGGGATGGGAGGGGAGTGGSGNLPPAPVSGWHDDGVG